MPEFQAPEMGHEKGYDGFALDIYCAGLTLLKMVVGEKILKAVDGGNKLYECIDSTNIKEIWFKIREAEELSKKSEDEVTTFSKDFVNLI